MNILGGISFDLQLATAQPLRELPDTFFDVSVVLRSLHFMSYSIGELFFSLGMRELKGSLN